MALSVFIIKEIKETSRYIIVYTYINAHTQIHQLNNREQYNGESREVQGKGVTEENNLPLLYRK